MRTFFRIIAVICFALALGISAVASEADGSFNIGGQFNTTATTNIADIFSDIAWGCSVEKFVAEGGDTVYTVIPIDDRLTIIFESITADETIMYMFISDQLVRTSYEIRNCDETSKSLIAADFESWFGTPVSEDNERIITSCQAVSPGFFFLTSDDIYDACYYELADGLFSSMFSYNDGVVEYLDVVLINEALLDSISAE